LERSQTGTLLRPILVGGTVAGILDQISAFMTFGWGVPRAIEGGLLGRQVIQSGSLFIWILGIALHFTIAFSAAAIYCLASRRLPFLCDHWLVCGMFYGIAVFLGMNLYCASSIRAPRRRTLPAARAHPGGPRHADHRSADLVQPAPLL
jgi:hypothetical protein